MKDVLLRVISQDGNVLKTFAFESVEDAQTASDILSWLSDEFGSDEFCIGSRLVVVDSDDLEYEREEGQQ